MSEVPVKGETLEEVIIKNTDGALDNRRRAKDWKDDGIRLSEHLAHAIESWLKENGYRTEAEWKAIVEESNSREASEMEMLENGYVSEKLVERLRKLGWVKKDIDNPS